jgi:16S rRNA (adenine1518-N6/adenine1519-N6)-dimethyltransferase
MTKVRAKKHLGQHFLKDTPTAAAIAGALTGHGEYSKALEIGPGMGVLTGFLLEDKRFETWVIEIDTESVTYLNEHFPSLRGRILEGDFLRWKPEGLGSPFAIIGNFPYNISSQIFFQIIEYRDEVSEVVCMLQKEVAQRIASPPGNRDYGILSVFLQAFYDIEYLFTVGPEMFTPPPKVQSGVIRLKRNRVSSLNCDEKLFFSVVKTAFNQRRKMLRNALRPLGWEIPENRFLDKRAEQLSVSEFEELTRLVDSARNR